MQALLCQFVFLVYMYVMLNIVNFICVTSLILNVHVCITFLLIKENIISNVKRSILYFSYLTIC